MQRISLDEFSRLRVDDLRATFSGRHARFLCVDWPQPFDWTSLVLIAPRKHALQFGGLPDAAFHQQVLEWQEQVATLENHRKIRSLLKPLGADDPGIFSFLGLPPVFGGEEMGRALEFPTSEMCDQVSYRVHSLLCSKASEVSVRRCWQRLLNQLKENVIIPAEEDADLSRHYNAEGDEMLLVDELIEKNRPNRSQELSRMLSERVDALEGAVKNMECGRMPVFAIRPWVFCQGHVDIIPRHVGLADSVSGVGSLCWQVAALRARLLRLWSKPVFFRAASEALQQPKLRAPIWVSAKARKYDFRAELEAYCDEVTAKHDAFACTV